MKIGVLSRYAPYGTSRARLTALLGEDVEAVWMSALPRDAAGTRGELKEARLSFAATLPEHNLDAVLALGNEALFVTTGRSGIMKYRGKEFACEGIPVLPSITPAAVERNPSQAALLAADVAAVKRMVTGEKVEGSLPQRLRVAASKSTLTDLLASLRDSAVVAFDLETSSFDELDTKAFVVSIAFTIERNNGELECWAVPLCHRASKWQDKWQDVLALLARDANTAPVRVAHNAKFDCRWLVQFQAPIPSNFDTMLAAHLLDENRAKGLKPLARILLNAPEWDIQIKAGKRSQPWYLQHPLKETLKYNALDTWHTYRLYKLFRPQLEEDARLTALFTKLIMPASQSLVHIERRGVYVDYDSLRKGAQQVDEELERIESALLAFVPDDPPFPVNWNPSNFLRWLLFDHLGLPALRVGKTGPSTAEDVMTHLAAQGYEIAKLLVERVKWQKFRSSFFNPYLQLITSESRLHTTFKLAGTVTGRLSSGKADADKVTGGKAERGVNLQQVPRDPLVRGIFGAQPGWTFIEADYSQVELRIAAEVSQEPTMLGLYSRGEDIHTTMAMRMTGKPRAEVTAHERKMAKAVNFGFLYGMGADKFRHTAWNNYGLEVSLEEAEQFRSAFFDQFPQLLKWHARQRRLAHQYKRVQSPLGRIRHLPDIDSPDRGVVGEAERQAINSPVQAMASDLCLLSLVLLDRKFRKLGLQAAPIGTVHDAINFECPDDELPEVIPLIKRTMENLPTQQFFGYTVKVPIVADVAIGERWGHKTEIPGDTIESTDRLKEWLNGR
jgi:DNA polymerase I-like protein with 3'-5' exonuclease and polymerase domains